MSNRFETEQLLDDMWTFDYRNRSWKQLYTYGDEIPMGTELKMFCISGKIYCIGEKLMTV